MDQDAKTIKTYDHSAQALSEYFSGIGSRVEDIELGLKLANTSGGVRAIEIGCGDGRDAAEIIKNTTWYEGFDPSEGLLNLARQKVPKTSFIKADALEYDYPKDTDIVFAFASLLHVSITNLPTVFEKVAHSLRPDGIFYISLKERETYAEELKKDEFGERMFYYYNPEIIKQTAGSAFVAVHEAHQMIGKTGWFTIALRRI